MASEIIVLLARGKATSGADYVEVHTFSAFEKARSFCELQQDLESKYWTRAEIVLPGETVQLDSPHEY